MLEVTVYNQAGAPVGKEKLSPAVFAVAINPAVIHQVVVAQQANARPAIANVKDRSQVSGGGKKPWRQKGTGRARHGSIRSPLWRGGGITFGPTSERNFSLKVNKKVRRKALLMSLSSKATDAKIVLLDELTVPAIKTKTIANLLENLKLRPKTAKAKTKTPATVQKTAAAKQPEKKRQTSVLVVVPETNQTVVKSARNIPRVTVVSANSLNTVAVLQHQYLLLPVAALKKIEQTFAK